MIGRLLAFELRRDRLVVPLWIAGTALMAYASAAGVQSEFPTDADREAVLRLAVATPSLLALRGIPDGASLGSYVFFQVFTYLAVLAALMTTFLVVRHSRGDEERGRAELLLAGAVARTAPLAATLLFATLANLVLGLAVAAAFVAGGLAAGPSLLTGLATASVGVAFAGVTALVAQLMPTSRGANGVAGGLVGLAFGLRAVGDALSTPGADGLSVVSGWPSWLSPIGWGQQVLPFGRDDATPLLLALALALATGGAALALRAGRDLGASLVRESRGRPRGGRLLTSPEALAWHEQRGSLVGWLVGIAALAALAGALGPRIADVESLAPQLQQLLAAFVPGGRGELVDLLVDAVLGIAGVVVAAAGVQALIRARGEEADGRSELVLAGPVGRIRWLLSFAVLALVSVVLGGLVAGLAGAATFVAAGDGVGRAGSTLLAGIAQIPAGVAYVGVIALVFALVPRLTIPLGWGLLVVGLALGQFGGLMNLPDAVRDLSPFAHTPAVAGGDADWSGAFLLLAVGAVGLVGALGAVRRREWTV